jgi:hypothetical protein
VPRSIRPRFSANRIGSHEYAPRFPRKGGITGRQSICRAHSWQAASPDVEALTLDLCLFYEAAIVFKALGASRFSFLPFRMITPDQIHKVFLSLCVSHPHNIVNIAITNLALVFHKFPLSTLLSHNRVPDDKLLFIHLLGASLFRRACEKKENDVVYDKDHEVVKTK